MPEVPPIIMIFIFFFCRKSIKYQCAFVFAQKNMKHYTINTQLRLRYFYLLLPKCYVVADFADGIGVKS